MKRTILFILALAVAMVAAPTEANARKKKSEVRNVIMLIGDGMGVAHISALMLEEKYQPINMDRAQAAALIKTYSANNRVTDSAAAGTALATGTKTGNHYIGVTIEGDTLASLITRAERRGMQTAEVVTCYLTHATPAAFYAHVPNRSQYEDIAVEFVTSGIDVAIGGGTRYFAKRKDGRNLIPELEAQGYKVAYSLDEIKDMKEGRVVALCADQNLPMAHQNRGDFLPDATAKALELLTANCKKAKKGFFMMIEGSQIDYAAHNTDAQQIYAEMKDFDKAVGVAFDYADNHEGTLVVVCADHETGGLSLPSKKTDFTLSESGVEYRYGTTSHSGSMIGALFYGAGAKEFAGIMDNTELSRRIAELLGL